MEDIITEPTFTLKDLQKTFIAGINRGCYITSVILSRPISEYPTFKNYIKAEYNITILEKSSKKVINK